MAIGKKTGGRNRGVPNRVNAELRDEIARAADPIKFLAAVTNGEAIASATNKQDEKPVTVIPTLDQRLHAAALLLHKICPPAKSAPIKLDLPAINNANDVKTAAGAVVSALGAGLLTPDDAKAVSDILEAFRRAIELSDHEVRLTALEAAAEKERRP